MTAIAPVLIKAFPADARADFRTKPRTVHFNRGVTAAVLEKFTAPFDDRGPVTRASCWMAVGGFAVLFLGSLVFGLVLLFIDDVFGTKILAKGSFLLGALNWNATVGGVLAVAGVALGLYSTRSGRPAAKAWRSALRSAWDKQGALLVPIKAVPAPARDEVQQLLARMEKVRKGLNRLEPAGDELDYARAAMMHFIDTSKLPENGARMAAATHITDQAVRRIAESYEFAVGVQESTRTELLTAIETAESLLADRRQAKEDADLIALANA
jgi:hypothetical protein